MKQTKKKGFTLVELIIVIAVIGVLAAILIPVFANVIKKANSKSALADARNAISQYVTESLERRALLSMPIPEQIVFIVEKGGRYYVFGYDTAVSQSIQVSSVNEEGILASGLNDLINTQSWNAHHSEAYDPYTTTTYSVETDGAFYLVPYTGTTPDNPDVRGFVQSTGVSGNFFRLDKEDQGYGFDLNVGNDTIAFHGCLVNGTYENTSTTSNDNSGSDSTTPVTPPAPASYSVSFTTTGIDDGDLANVVFKKGGASLTNPATLTEGTGVGTLTAECPVATSAYSYTFTGATASNGHSTIDEAGMTITFAFTKVMAQTYNVMYNANGGTGTMTDNTDYLTNAVVTLPANTFTAPEHKHFTGWLINNTGELRAAGYQFNITADTEIYAQWGDDVQITVHFNANGGSGTMADDSVYAGSYTLPECSFTKAHHTFNGWKANNEGGILGETYNVTEEVTFYATWVQDATYTITYDGNGATGSAPTDSNSYYMNDSATLAANTFTYTHKHFTGWKVANGGALLAAGSEYTVTGSVTMYAQWEDDATYTVTYNGNGATGGTTPTDANSYYSGESATLAANTFTYTHKHFTGWKAANEGSLLAADSSYTVTGNVTMYAQWENDATYTVTYNANGGTGTMTDSTAYYAGDSATVLANTFTRTNYTFKYFTTTAADTGTHYAANDSITVNGNVILYAQWEEQQQAQGQNCTFNLTFLNYSGSPTIAENVVYNATCPVGDYKLTTTELVDAGVWPAHENASTTGSSYIGCQYNKRTFRLPYWTINISSGVTSYSLTIYLSAVSCSYAYDPNDGSIDANTGTNFAMGDTIIAANNTFSNNGYTFTGWNTAPDGSGESYMPGDSIVMCPARSTLFAQWTPNGQPTDARTQFVIRFVDIESGSGSLSSASASKTLYQPGRFAELTFNGMPRGLLRKVSTSRFDMDVEFVHQFFDSCGYPKIEIGTDNVFVICNYSGSMILTNANGDPVTTSSLNNNANELVDGTYYIYITVKQI